MIRNKLSDDTITDISTFCLESNNEEEKTKEFIDFAETLILLMLRTLPNIARFFKAESFNIFCLTVTALVLNVI